MLRDKRLIQELDVFAYLGISFCCYYLDLSNYLEIQKLYDNLAEGFDCSTNFQITCCSHRISLRKQLSMVIPPYIVIPYYGNGFCTKSLLDYAYSFSDSPFQRLDVRHQSPEKEWIELIEFDNGLNLCELRRILHNIIVGVSTEINKLLNANILLDPLFILPETVHWNEATSLRYILLIWLRFPKLNDRINETKKAHAQYVFPRQLDVLWFTFSRWWYLSYDWQ